MARLRDQTALITGASGGIGGAIAFALAREGARVCLCGRDAAKLESLEKQFHAASHQAKSYAVDLTRDDEIERLVGLVSADPGRLDVLVHSAGVIEHGKLEAAPVAALDRMYDANVRGPLLLTQKLLPLLKRPRGQIVFINSTTGLAAPAGTGHFSATQHAFKALADALRDEVNGDGVRVLSVFPGRTATSRIEALHRKEGRPYRPEVLLQPEDVASVVVNALTLPWTAEVTNITIRPMQKSY